VHVWKFNWHLRVRLHLKIEVDFVGLCFVVFFGGCFLIISYMVFISLISLLVVWMM